jgi:hypothetical protein
MGDNDPVAHDPSARSAGTSPSMTMGRKTEKQWTSRASSN